MRKLDHLAITFVAATIAFSARSALAEDPPLFPRGAWSLSGYGSYTHSFTGEHAKMGAGTLGLGYYLFDNFSLNAELGLYHNDQSGPDSTIYDANLLIRHHLLQHGRFSLFLDAGAGLTYASERTPPSGTYFNFMEEAGIGATFRLQGDLHLIGGVRYFHMSNARIEGPDRNPSINATQGYVGLLWRF